MGSVIHYTCIHIQGSSENQMKELPETKVRRETAVTKQGLCSPEGIKDASTWAGGKS